MNIKILILHINLFILLLYAILGCSRNHPDKNEYHDICFIVSVIEKKGGRVIDFPPKTENKYKIGMSVFSPVGYPLSGSFPTAPNSPRIEFSYDAIENHWYQVQLLQDIDGNYSIITASYPEARDMGAASSFKAKSETPAKR